MNHYREGYPCAFRNKQTGAYFKQSALISVDDTPRYYINPNSKATYHISHFDDTNFEVVTHEAMSNDEHKIYIHKYTENGVVLFEEVSKLDAQIKELDNLKRRLLHKFGTSHKLLLVGERIELTWPNGYTETIDIITSHAPMVKYDNNEYDLVYGYRRPNKDGTVAKIGALRQVWQSQLEVNGYKKIK